MVQSYFPATAILIGWDLVHIFGNLIHFVLWNGQSGRRVGEITQNHS